MTATSVPSGRSTVVARGANFLLARDFVVKTHGDAVWSGSLARLSPAHRAVWQGPLILIGTYDFAAFKALTAAVAAETRNGDERALAAMYAYVADQSLSTLYKVFFRLANPSFVIANFPKLWSRFFTTGQVEVPVATRERAELQFRLPSIFLDWIGPACLGYSTKAVELAGGRDVRVRQTGQRALDGDEWEIDFEVTWREGR